MRRDIAGIRHADDEVRATIKRVYEERGICWIRTARSRTWASKAQWAGGRRRGQVGIFLATAHPAKFSEIVEPIIGRAIETPAPLTDALARPRHILRIDASLEAVAEALRG